MTQGRPCPRPATIATAPSTLHTRLILRLNWSQMTKATMAAQYQKKCTSSIVSPYAALFEPQTDMVAVNAACIGLHVCVAANALHAQPASSCERLTNQDVEAVLASGRRCEDGHWHRGL